MSLAYVDASALTKLIVDEPASAAMHRWYVEAERLELILRTVVLIEVDRSVALQAAAMRPPQLRTVDAIHLASAQGLVGQLDAFVTYDDRLAEAARAAGLPVVRPQPVPPRSLPPSSPTGPLDDR